ncbi:hypothetical protein [Bacillus thuringiensis]|uniref:hypothetical protein n=1 Tax=Bacillus thuringiensis TaxID=1428 RepID=UPI00077E39B6|nr:hypothetical protein [Bacillus thuringiensis]AMR05749.1 hypothetical protein AXW78_26950 [Bacillus thuringiensis]PNK35972.1 hypothetical protein CBR55_22930 [Bacillus thuringiensis]
MNDNFKEKRLLYNNSEDLYFLAYNLILILSVLDCKTNKSSFKDYRKLIFLIPIISNEKNTQLLLNYYKNDIKPNAHIIKELNRIYYDAIETITLIRYLLLILEKRNIIKIIVEDKKVNIYLLENETIKMFIQDNKFEKEKRRIIDIKGKIKTLKRLNYMTFVNNFFKINGVAIWEQ